MQFGKAGGCLSRVGLRSRSQQKRIESDAAERQDAAGKNFSSLGAPEDARQSSGKRAIPSLRRNVEDDHLLKVWTTSRGQRLAAENADLFEFLGVRRAELEIEAVADDGLGDEGWSVAPVMPTPRPKLTSHFGERFRSIAGTI